jgi:hypothetical protein
MVLDLWYKELGKSYIDQTRKHEKNPSLWQKNVNSASDLLHFGTFELEVELMYRFWDQKTDLN